MRSDFIGYECNLADELTHVSDRPVAGTRPRSNTHTHTHDGKISEHLVSEVA